MSIDIINRLVNHKVLGVSGDQTTYQYDIPGDLFVSGDVIVSGGFFSGASNDYVPYTGAGKNVDLGAKNLVTTGSLYGGSVYGVTGSFSGSLFSLDIQGQDISGTNVYASQLCGSVGTDYTPSGLWLESGAYILSGPGLAGSSFNTSGAGVTYAGSFYGLAGSITGSLYVTDIEGIDISGTNVYASQLCGSVGTDFTPSGLWLESGAYVVSGPVFTGSVYGVISGVGTSFATKLYGNEMLISGTIGNTIISGNLLVNDNDFNVSGGRVGIGTATPDYHLDVNPSAGTAQARIRGEASSALLRMDRGDTGDTDAIFFETNTAADFKIGTGIYAVGTSFDIGDNTNSFVTILTGGNVGIGTASPGDTLTVSGTCHISEVLTLGSTAVPAGAAGNMYYNAGSDMIYAYVGGAWAAIA